MHRTVEVVQHRPAEDLHAVITAPVSAGPLPPVPDYVPNEEEVEVELLGPRGTWIPGALQVLVRTDVPEWLLGHVRAAGGEAEVLRPPKLRHDLLDSVDPAVGEGGRRRGHRCRTCGPPW